MNEKEFIDECEKINIFVTNEQKEKLKIYFSLLKDWNQKFNLTTILDEESVYLKHFYDSICIVKTGVIKNENQKLCDFGSGAGFPGIIIKLLFENISVTLIESNSKKCIFLNKVVEELKLRSIEIVNDRAEIYAKKNREKFDIVTCRAVSHLKIICELAIPLLKVNGYFIPLKANLKEELKESKEIIENLNSKVLKIISYELPVDKSVRNIPIIQKELSTDVKYPREYNKILKN